MTTTPKSMPVEKLTTDMLNSAQASAIAKVTRNVISVAVAQGKLPAYHLDGKESKSGRRQLYFKRSELKEWVVTRPRRATRSNPTNDNPTGPALLIRLESKMDWVLEMVKELKQMWS